MKDFKGFVDRARGLVKRVRICGNDGKNGYAYSPRTKRILKSLYEGFAVRWDHLAPGQGGSRTGFAVIRNVTDDPDGMRGDLQLFYPEGTEEQRFLGLCEQNARGIGLSHHILAHKAALKRQGATTLVDTDDPKHIKLASVDLVEEPSTNHSIFEGTQLMTVEGYQHIFEQEEAPADGYALLSQAMAAFQASGDTDMATKIHKLLKPQAKEEAAPASPAEAAPEEMKEQAQTPEGFVAISESALDRLAKSLNVKPTASLKKLLAKGSLEDALEILESLKAPAPAPGKQTTNQPRPNGKAEVVPNTVEARKARYAS